MDNHVTIIFYGTLIHSLSPTTIEVLQKSLIAVNANGSISHVAFDLQENDIDDLLKYFTDHNLRVGHEPPDVRYLSENQFLIPGFIDTHNHAPQFPQRGLGRGMQILDWLDKLTFRNEAKFSDSSYARKIYPKLVRTMLQHGVTAASYYGSIHLDATKVLADVCLEQGQRALIGKTNMDAPGQSPEWYREADAESSLTDTISLIKYVHHLDPESALIKPVITPRFAISCTPSLLSSLGALAKAEHPDNPYNEDLPIQTHFNEAASEISYTLSLFKSYGLVFKDEVELYTHFSLLTSHSVLAHCTTGMTASAINALRDKQCGVAHCPIANVTVGGGFMVAPIRNFLHHGLDKIGLGTDVGGGWSCNILDVMKWAWVSSNCRAMMGSSKEDGRWAQLDEDEHEEHTESAGHHAGSEPLTIAECFYMSTLGGARVLSLDAKIGNFLVGKEFDALLVDLKKNDDHVDGDDDEIEKDVMVEFEKFLVRGDDRHIAEVYVKGRKVKG